MNKVAKLIFRLLILTGIAVLALSACAGQPAPATLEVAPGTASPSATSTAVPLTLTPTSLPSSTVPAATPTTALPATATPRPTLQAEEALATIMNFLLDNGECEYPCVWGIEPGVTSKAAVLEFFSYLREIPSEHPFTGGHREITGHFQNLDEGISVLLIVGIKDDLVSYISMGGSIQSAHPQSGSVLDKYSFTSILEQLGTPDIIQVVLSPTEMGWSEFVAYDIWFQYEGKGVIFFFSGVAVLTGTDYRVCPNGSPTDRWNSISIMTQKPGEGRDLIDLFRLYAGLPEGLLPVEDALGMTTQEFVDYFVNTELDTCLIVDPGIWQAEQ